MVKLIRNRPLPHLGLQSVPKTHAENTIAEVAYQGLVNLRVDGGDKAAMKALSDASISLPVRPNTSHQGPSTRCLWLGPDEWLLINPDQTGDLMAAELAKVLGNIHHSAKDVSQNYQTIRLQGPAVRLILNKLTPLDVHPSVLTSGQCAQTVMAKSIRSVGYC